MWDYTMKSRYLTLFSYIGTQFRSSEKLWTKNKSQFPDPSSVQGVIELGLLKLRPQNYPKVILSSRTDGGVHALNASAHFDLRTIGGIQHPNYIAFNLNKFFNQNDVSVIVKKVIRVNDDFHARFNAKSRTYLFRLATLKNNAVLEENLSLPSYIPIEEWRRCCFLRVKNFDIDRFKAGAKYLEGVHDFTTFKKFDKRSSHKHNRRCIYSIETNAGQPITTAGTNDDENLFDYWDIKIHGRAFVHNQIRRMIGTLVSVAVGKLEPKDVQLMLQIPSKESWYGFIQSMSAHGLYLTNVEYDPNDLIFNENSFSDTKRNSREDVDDEDDEDIEE